MIYVKSPDFLISLFDHIKKGKIRMNALEISSAGLLEVSAPKEEFSSQNQVDQAIERRPMSHEKTRSLALKMRKVRFLTDTNEMTG
ncbi:hypothetical protein ACFLU6_01720 [Acidobacteriota bacterium]